MAEIKSLHFQNFTGQTIFLLIKAKENGPIEFTVYSRALQIRPSGGTICELEDETEIVIKNRNYTTHSVIDKSGRELILSTEREGETINIILEANQN